MFTPKNRLNSEWRRWIAENLLLRVDEETILDRLVAEGLSQDTCKKAITSIKRSAVFSAGMALSGRLDKLESLFGIRHELTALLDGSFAVPRLKNVSHKEFFNKFYALNTPVALIEMVPTWPAYRMWSPQYLKEKFGSALVNVSLNRRNELDYHARIGEHSKEMPLESYVDLVEASGETNDHYLVANNHALENESLSGLFRDIGNLDQYLDPSDALGKSFLWFGPKGTITPLHHDRMNVLLAQVYGTKRVRMIPPHDTPLVYNEVGVYSSVDLEDPNLERFPLFQHARVIDIEMQAGDILFIPVGWWHHVRSLSVSIAVSFTNFRMPNDYEEIWPVS